MDDARTATEAAAPACPLSAPSEDEGEALPLVLFRRQEQPIVKVVPAGRWRGWMNDTWEHHANRCLPLLMANQAGWVLLNPAPFTATWDGGDLPSALTVEYPSGTPKEQRIAETNFGDGILTFIFHDLLCTPPGYNLWARGPTNSPKDGIGALDGLIETDWSAASFTMNWKLTRPGSVTFEADEPFCHILPQRRGELERFRPEVRGLEANPELERRISAWAGCRKMVQLGKHSMEQQGNDRWRRLWLDSYFRGKSPTGESNPEHQTTIRLAPFADES